MKKKTKLENSGPTQTLLLHKTRVEMEKQKYRTWHIDNMGEVQVQVLSMSKSNQCPITIITIFWCMHSIT
jgi:hypothetical protein